MINIFTTMKNVFNSIPHHYLKFLLKENGLIIIFVFNQSHTLQKIAATHSSMSKLFIENYFENPTKEIYDIFENSKRIQNAETKFIGSTIPLRIIPRYIRNKEKLDLFLQELNDFHKYFCDSFLFICDKISSCTTNITIFVIGFNENRTKKVLVPWAFRCYAEFKFAVRDQ